MTQVLPLSPAAIADWIPFARAAGFFLATFVLEDVAAVGAGLLLATGGISWPAAFAACFLGIWMGDAGLYVLARFAGRKCFERSSLRRFAAKVAESEQWFAKRGTPILIFSRAVPGARLPTYLAAGFLRVPLPRFLLITGAASCIWTAIVLFLSQTFGERLVGWLGAYRHAGLMLLCAGVALFVVLQLLRRVLVDFNFQSVRTRLNRLRRWEFWPAWLFYPPVGIYCLWLALKHRGLSVVTCSNPGIFSGGIVGESKIETLRDLFATSPEFTAEAELVVGRTVEGRKQSLERIQERLSERALTPALSHPMGERESSSVLLELEASKSVGASFPESTVGDGPYFSSGISRQAGDQLLDANDGNGANFSKFILKPDVGQRGAGIKLIRSREQAEAYLRQTPAALIAQRYAPGPHEAGIFYYRFPHETHGRIFSIVEKLFPVVTGDGNSTVEELVERDPRARLISDKYLARFGRRRKEVLREGETLKLVEAGNHAQGSIFCDGERFRTPELEARIDEISKKLTGFYIGRYDIRYANEKDLRAGKNFQIIELNGAAAEAGSIYDARNSLLSAYRTLFRQWELVFAIGAENRRRGCEPTKLSVVWRKWRDYSRMAATYPASD